MMPAMPILSRHSCLGTSPECCSADSPHALPVVTSCSPKLINGQEICICDELHFSEIHPSSLLCIWTCQAYQVCPGDVISFLEAALLQCISKRAVIHVSLCDRVTACCRTELVNQQSKWQNDLAMIQMSCMVDKVHNCNTVQAEVCCCECVYICAPKMQNQV